ncbi:hypothetical protein EVAR_58245_1 [Eumeta japonica]|uniref:Uncharacterized protein n=1 Tax=Eumeta variegata TaxID=151549 RepID=A0A4C2AGZ1_EUMVA|nr:hypothetical protein EVAR_58245_1 [Eumeta japonica]
MSPTSCKLKTRRHHGSTRKKFGRPEQLVDEVLKEVKVMSRLTDSGREINDFAITTRNCVACITKRTRARTAVRKAAQSVTAATIRCSIRARAATRDPRGQRTERIGRQRNRDEYRDRHHHLNECHLEALRDARPLLLIGQDNWELITGSDVRRGKSGEPVASLTGLGERENAEVKRASRILNDTTRRIGNKWETGLLWKEDDPRFPDNYNGARKRLTNIENKMDRDPAFAAAYTAQIEKLIENGYARRLENRAQVRDCFFLPHFAVTNPNKPNKIRVVFDAAARSREVAKRLLAFGSRFVK